MQLSKNFNKRSCGTEVHDAIAKAPCCYSNLRGYGIWGELVRSILAVHSAPGRPQMASAFNSFSTLYSILRIKGIPLSRIR
jgi:hypothetical protein